MTDLEATRLCAVAMGLEVRLTADETKYFCSKEYTKEYADHYDPLHDDAQAMALGKSDPALFATVVREWAHEMLMGRAANLNAMLVYEFAAMQQAKNSAK